jgi:hypothetical protein
MSSSLTQASDSPDGVNSIILLFIILIAAVVVFSLVGYLCSTIARHGHLPRTRQELLTATAVLFSCSTLCLYAWGALHIIFMEDPNMREACVKAGGETRAAEVQSYDGNYFPIGFVCRTETGNSYSAAVPGYVNPAMSASFAVALTAGGVAWADQRRGRASHAQAHT